MAVVATTGGLVRGVAHDGVLTFRGIPYAEAARFAAPRQPQPWSQIRDAAEFGPIAPQIPGAQFQRAELAQNEDCLSLNVWAPEDLGGGPRPVLVWIHGGAFRQGSGASPLYDGERLARRGDVVVITLNYRIGALGFLAHPDLGDDAGCCGNWGLLDQIEALRWVAANAAGFGGDAANVTIFGESAGGASVLLLCASPLGRGLFHKAIAQSGAPMTLTGDTAAELAERLASVLGVAGVADLHDVPVADLLDAQASLADWRTVRTFAPCVDGVVLDGRPVEALAAGSAAGVPLIVGTNVDEWKLWAPLDPHSRDLDPARLRRRVERVLPEGAEEVIDVVRTARSARGEPVKANDLWFAIESDRFFRVPALRAADAHAASPGAATFVYLFAWGSPAMNGWLGACHGLEIAFVFGNQGRGDIAAFTGSGRDADALAGRMMDAWVAFARDGDPATTALAWPAHEPSTRPTLLFDAAPRGAHAPREPERAVVDKHLAPS